VTEGTNVKVKAIQEGGGAGFGRYRALCYGKTSLGYALKAECITALTGGMPGAAGLFLRSRLYPCLFGRVGRDVLIGKNVTLRHPRKIRLGDRVILDDRCMLDAKGEDNEGITIGNGAFIGRNTIVYCKNGDIRLEEGVNVSSNCTLFSSNRLTVGAGTVIGGYSYLLSGGEYDYADAQTRFCDQSGMQTRGELTVGGNCWLGARVTVLDAASIGEHCVLGAGAVVVKPIPSDSLAVGVPARVVKSIRAD